MMSNHNFDKRFDWAALRHRDMAPLAAVLITQPAEIDVILGAPVNG